MSLKRIAIVIISILGPFKLVSYEKDKEAVLARNDQYWGIKPKVDKVVWKTIPDSHAQIVALKAGEIDMVGITEHHSSVPYVEVPGLKKAGINVEVKSYGRYQVLEYNCQRELFMDKNVRMAFNYAIDKDKMVKELFDANWNLRFFNEEYRLKFKEDERDYMDKYGEEVPYVKYTEKMNEFRRSMPMNSRLRPQWDFDVLLKTGFTKIYCKIDITERVWDEAEKLKYRSRRPV